MGFRTVAIEQRASEVLTVLGAVKTEFSRFGDVLTRVKRQLDTASKTIETAGVRTRAMERRLRSVEQLSPEMSAAILQLPAAIDDSDSQDEAVNTENPEPEAA